MKKNYFLLALACLLFGIPLKAQFSGAFAPANWGTVAVNSDGQTYTTSAPSSIYMTSGNNLSGSAGTNDFTIAIAQSGVISFSWAYSTSDGSQYDYPQYAINNGAGVLVNGYSTSGGTSQSGTQPCISVNAGDVFKLRMYTVDNIAGAATCTFSGFLFTIPSVTISPANPTVCPGQTLALTASGGTNYSWSGGITNGVPFTPTTSGIYTLTSGPSGCTTQKTVSVTYNPPLSISGPTTKVCANSSVTLVGLGGSTYTWNTGAVGASVVVTPSVNSSYSVNGVSNQGCNTQGVINVTVDPGIPTLTVNSSSSAGGTCPGSTVILTASGASTYTWTGPYTPITNGIAFTPTTSGSYVVTGSNSCGSSTAAISLSVHPLPTVGAVAATGSICSGNTTTINVTGNAVSNTITSVGQGPAVSNGVGFTPAQTNTYIVIGTSALGCTASANASVLVIQTPTLAPTSSSLLICIGKSATLTATGATGGYTWTSGSATLANTSTLAVTPNTTTTYSITKNSSTCFDTKAITITVKSLTPVFAASSSTLICATSPVTLSAFGGISYAWYSSSAPTTSFSPSSNPVVSPSISTTYTVAASDGTCINSAAITVSTNPIPTISVIPSATAICLGQTATLQVSGGVNYTWSTVPITTVTSGQTTLAPSFPAAGAYAFNVSGDNSFNCTAIGSTVIIVNSAPSLSATATKTLICSGNSTTLNVTGGNLYQWDNAANSANTTSVIVNPSGTTIFNVTGTLSATGCTASTNIQVNIYTPNLSITNPTNTCLGAAITLTGQVNNPSSGAVNSYTWSVPGTGNSNGSSVIVTPTVLTTYTLSAKSSTTGGLSCIQSKTTSVGIFYNPTITVVPSRTFVCKNEPVNLVASGGVSYTWNNNSFTGGTITVTNANVGTVSYTVVGTDANGCVNNAIYYLKINGCQGIAEFGANSVNLSIYPNPNSGEFQVTGDRDLKLLLVNELGQIIKRIELNAANSQSIRISDLAKGIYFITGEHGEAVTRQKIIIN